MSCPGTPAGGEGRGICSFRLQHTEKSRAATFTGVADAARRLLPMQQAVLNLTMSSRNSVTMMGIVRLKSKILPASAAAGIAMSMLATNAVAAGFTTAGSSTALQESQMYSRSGPAQLSEAIIAAIACLLY